MLETIKNIHKKYGMKTALSMLDDFSTGFPTEDFYLNCILDLKGIKVWKDSTLINVINRHEKEFTEKLCQRLMKGNYKNVQTICKNAGDKFKGNILEIITEQLCNENMFLNMVDNNITVRLDHVIGADADLGIDILMQDRNNPNWKVGLQIKYRTFEEIDYRSGAISKTSDMVRREMEKNLNEHKITDIEYLDWVKNCKTKIILVTTTKANYKLTDAMPDLQVIDGKKLTQCIMNNMTLWDSIYKSIQIEMTEK